jgi:hypothetical protein
MNMEMLKQPMENPELRDFSIWQSSMLQCWYIKFV